MPSWAGKSAGLVCGTAGSAEWRTPGRPCLPAIALVNYQVEGFADGESVVFWLGMASGVGATSRGQVVAFQAEASDPVTGTGWSVVLCGRTEPLAETAVRRGLRSLPVHPSSANGPNICVRVTGELISGRAWNEHPAPAIAHGTSTGTANGTTSP